MRIQSLENVGAEVTEVDLGNLTDDAFAAIRAAFSEHGLSGF